MTTPNPTSIDLDGLEKEYAQFRDSDKRVLDLISELRTLRAEKEALEAALRTQSTTGRKG